MTNLSTINETEPIFFLSDIIGRKITLAGKKIGRLQDIIIFETEKIPEVTHIIVGRSFGYQSLLIPWKNVAVIRNNEIIIDIEDIEKYEKEPIASQVLLKDHILDKKVLDLDDNEVEVVYDVKLSFLSKKLYVTDVDSSKYGLLKRIGLKWLVNFIYNLADIIKTDTIPWTYVQPLPEDMSSFKGNVKLKVLKEKLPDIHPVDLADILEELDHDQRLAIFNELDTEHASDTLEEIEPRVQRDLISSLQTEKTVELINDMTPGQAADILAILPATDADEILAQISDTDKENAEKIQFILDKQDEKIINFATSHIFKFLPSATVKEAIDEFHRSADEKDVIMYLYIVDEEDKLIGIADIKELLQAKAEDNLGEIMATSVISLDTESTLMEASRMFTRYLFRALPIVDENDKIQGAIPYRDIMSLSHRFI
ncbi:MAG: CBS domain-containing protein [Candidatus Gastranaerophilaceae bacterium]|jgi:CBS domain-containing protein/sporulation protein YlmC with PRC-barrel domain